MVGLAQPPGQTTLSLLDRLRNSLLRCAHTPLQRPRRATAASCGYRGSVGASFRPRLRRNRLQPGLRLATGNAAPTHAPRRLFNKSGVGTYFDSTRSGTPARDPQWHTSARMRGSSASNLLVGAALGLAVTHAATPDHTATWTGDIWGLPNGLLPAGPVIGQGDFGMSLQTNNATGCVELWLGLNSMWGMPPAPENPQNNTLGSGNTNNPFAPYPSQQFLGALKICVADASFRQGANFTAEQRLADGTILARYVAADGRRSFSTRSFLHPTDKLLVTECAFDGLAGPTDAPIVTLQSWTKTLWFNATAEAAAGSTRAGWDAASGTQWFSRVAIPGNDAARRSKQLHVVVGTRLIADDSSARALRGTGNHSVQCNETAARAGKQPLPNPYLILT